MEIKLKLIQILYQVIHFYSALFNFNSNPQALDPLLKGNWFEKMIPYADYYNEDLQNKLTTINFDEISDKMKKFNQNRKNLILDKWRQTINFI